MSAKTELTEIRTLFSVFLEMKTKKKIASKKTASKARKTKPAKKVAAKKSAAKKPLKIKKKALKKKAISLKKRPAAKSQILRFNENHFFRVEMSQQVTILNPQGRQVGRLRDLSAYIWLQLNGTKSLKEIIEKAQTELGIQDPKFKKLVETFTQDLLAKKLVHSIQEKTLSPQPELPQLDLSLINKDVRTLKKVVLVKAAPLAIDKTI